MRLTRDQIGLETAAAGPGRLDPRRVAGIALHWPGIAKPITTIDAAKASLRGWQRLHMDTRGWSDIAYQEAIDQAGNTYVLRGLRNQSGANGNADVNERYGALLLIVAEHEQPSDLLIRAVQRRIARHRELFPLSRRIVGHQDVRPEPTSCPGPAIEGLIGKGAFNPPGAHK